MTLLPIRHNDVNSGDVEIDWEPFFDSKHEAPSFNELKAILSREIAQDLKENLREEFKTHRRLLGSSLHDLKHFILSHTLRAIMVSFISCLFNFSTLFKEIIPI